MAKQKASGVDGSLTFVSGHNACFDTWSLTFGQRMNVVTCFGDTNESNLGGLQYGSFSATGTPVYDAANTSPGPAAMTKAGASATFQVATGCTIAVTCIVAQCALSSDVNGAARVAYSGPTSGSPTVVWDES